MDLESEGTPDFMAEGIAAFQEALSSEEAEPAPEPAEALGDAEEAAEGEEVSEEGVEKKALIKRLKEEGDKARSYEQLTVRDLQNLLLLLSFRARLEA